MAWELTCKTVKLLSVCESTCMFVMMKDLCIIEATDMGQ